MSDTTDTINFDDLEVVTPQSTDSFVCGRGRISFSSLLSELQDSIDSEESYTRKGTITDKTSTTINLSPVKENTMYIYGTLTSLYICNTSIYESLAMESVIFFSSGTTATNFDYFNYDIIGSITTEPNTDYIIILRNGTLELKALNTNKSSIILPCYDSDGNVISGQYATLKVKVEDGIPTFVPVLL